MTARTLVLVRHAKAANPDDYPTDIERPLAPRGQRDATAAGDWLRSAGYVPDAVLCSPAVRARETLEGLGFDNVPVVYERQIYAGPAPDVLNLIHQTTADVATLLLVGHNPTVSDLSDMLAPGGLSDSGLATAGMAVHRFDGTWRSLSSAALLALHTSRG
jgi:phosphohistidine phosphatase